eukprot:scaffold395020_cov32-Prasinocladus_malaysianus.AAC.1
MKPWCIMQTAAAAEASVVSQSSLNAAEAPFLSQHRILFISMIIVVFVSLAAETCKTQTTNKP